MSSTTDRRDGLPPDLRVGSSGDSSFSPSGGPSSKTQVIDVDGCAVVTKPQVVIDMHAKEYELPPETAKAADDFAVPKSFQGAGGRGGPSYTLRECTWS